MCGLCKRQIEFVRLMLEEADYKSILYFSKQLHVSDKTLKEDLKGIRAYLRTYGIEIHARTGKGILVDQSAKNNVNILNDLHSEVKDVLPDVSQTTQARRLNILKNMLLRSDMNTSIQKLSDQYYVSKASIVNDIKYLERWLERFHLTIDKTIEGSKIKGNEADIRQAMAFLIQSYKDENFKTRENSEYVGIVRLDGRTIKGLLELFDIEDIIFIEALLEKLEIESDIHIGDIYYVNLLTHILLCIKRVKEGISIEDNKVGLIRTDTIKQYRKAQNITEKIKNKYQIDLGEGETYYIYQYLISSGLEEMPVEMEENDESLRLSVDLTNKVSEIVGIDFRRNKELLNGLLLHIRPMLNRLKYDIQLGNPLLDEIRELFPQMLGICQIVMELLSRKYHLKKIVIDEIAYIATYYQTMLRHVVTPKNVLVVCHSGYGTSQLLAAKLKHEFSFITIVDVVSSRRIECMDLNGIEFIVSTVPINVKSIPHIVISALLTEQDIQDIKNSFQTSIGNNRGNRYLKCIPKYINMKNIFINEESELFTIQKENLIAETDLLPDLHVQVREAEKSEVFIYLNNKEQSKEKIKIILSVSDEETLKLLLSDIYKLSVLKKDTDTLKESASVDDVAGFFEERGL